MGIQFYGYIPRRSITNPRSLAEAWCGAQEPSAPEQPVTVTGSITTAETLNTTLNHSLTRHGEHVPDRTMESDSPDETNVFYAQLNDATAEIAAANADEQAARRRRDLAIEQKCKIQGQLDRLVRGQQQKGSDG